MITYVIEGGTPLKGEITVLGSKMATLKMMVAALLTPDPVTLKNVPRKSEIDVLIDALQFLGAKVNWKGENEITISAEKLTHTGIPRESVRRCRASFLIFGALLARQGKAVVPDPTDLDLGTYPVDHHIKALKQLKIIVEKEDGFFHGHGQPSAGVIEFDKHTLSGTEHAIISSVLAKGETIIKNAAQEPELDNLIEILNSMGAQIKRSPPREITIQGVDMTSGTTATVMGDRIDAMTIAISAGMTRGEVLIKGVRSEYLTSALSKLKEIGINFKVTDEGLLVWVSDETAFSPTTIETKPYPGFMAGWLPCFTALLTQADGESVIHDTIYSQEFGYVSELKKMGAEITLFNPKLADPNDIYQFNIEDAQTSNKHGAKIFGPTPLVGTKLRALNTFDESALIVSALTAKGVSELKIAEQLNSKPNNLINKLRDLGANIEVRDN